MKQLILKYLLKLYNRLSLLSQQKKYEGYRSKYKIAQSFRFNGNNIEFYLDGIIECGDNSYIGEYSSLQAYPGRKIVIGNNCMISHNVRMYTQSLNPDNDFSIYPHQEKTGDILIGDFVWIGANVFINPGVKIGNNAVVGANSVVTKDVPDFAIVGGVPAKLIRFKKLDESVNNPGF